MHLIVHGGPPKTGTTALQRALFSNPDGLAAAGIRYFVPEKPEEWTLALPYVELIQKGKLPRILKKDFASVDEALAMSEQSWTDLARVVRREKPQTLVISSEHFSNLAQPEAFIERLRGLSERITFVAYARDPVALYVSELDEMIRGGSGLDQLLLPQRFGYYAMRNLQRIEKILGADNLVIRNFDRASLVGGDIGRDFFALLERLTGQPCRGDVFPAEVNSSICGAGTAWLLTLNEALPIEGGGVAQFRTLFERRQALIQAIRQDETLSRLPRLTLNDPELVQLVRQSAQPVVDWINGHYMEGQVPLRSMAEPIEVEENGRIRTLMRDWILSYLETDTLQALGRVVVKA